MKTPDLIEHVASAAGVEKNTAEQVVGAVFAGIINAAKKGEEVSLTNFGKFKIRDSPARPGRNPGTGEAVEIAASRKLVFISARQVKDALAG